MDFMYAMAVLSEAYAGLSKDALKGIVRDFDEVPVPLRKPDEAVEHLREVSRKVNAVHSALLHQTDNELSHFHCVVLSPTVNKLRRELEDAITGYFQALKESLVAELLKNP